MQAKVGIGLLGCGTVGQNVAVGLVGDRAAIERRAGVNYELRSIAVRSQGKARDTALHPGLFRYDPLTVIEDPNVDLVIECIGGTRNAGDLVERALDRRCHVITANKELLATQGPRLQAIAAARGVTLRYEAAVGGAIPIIRVLEDALAGDEVRAIAGVFNGTCTSILSSMEGGSDYSSALARAQELGYAEADPTEDVEGIDAAHKLAVLIQLAFGLAVASPRIRRQGIAKITRQDIALARESGLRVRLVAAAVRLGTTVFADVAPLLVAERHPFARVRGAENIARIIARDAGTLELNGTGAGGPATASAVLGDVVSTLRAIGERHDFSLGGRTRTLEPAHEVASLFDTLPRHPDLRHLSVWIDEQLCVDPLFSLFRREPVPIGLP
jgi:homoserine dehydrogenase